MIRDRLWLAPWWVRGLVQTMTSALVVGTVVVELYPMFVIRAGWPLTVLAVVALCGTTTGAVLYLQAPVRRRGLAALGEHSQRHRLESLRALRTGEVPRDPGVLAAAVRYGDVVRGVSRTRRVMQWLVPAVAIGYGVFESFRLPLRFGALLIAVGVWWIALSLLRRRQRSRTLRNLEVLRAAAGPDAAAAGPGDAVTAVPPWRYRLAVVAVMVPVIAFTTLVYVVTRADPDCYYVAGAADLIHDQWTLSDPQNMTRGQPDLAAYRRWARQLRDYADTVTDPRLEPGLRRIADLADEAVALFAQSRDIQQPPDLGAQQRAFGAVMQKLADEDNAVFAVCFPRR